MWRVSISSPHATTVPASQVHSPDTEAAPQAQDTRDWPRGSCPCLAGTLAVGTLGDLLPRHQEMEQARRLWSMVWLRRSRSAGSGFRLAQARQREARRPQHRPAAQQTARGSDLTEPRLSAHLPAWTPATSVPGQRPPRLRCPECSAGLTALLWSFLCLCVSCCRAGHPLCSQPRPQSRSRVDPQHKGRWGDVVPTQVASVPRPGPTVRTRGLRGLTPAQPAPRSFPGDVGRSHPYLPASCTAQR